MSIHSNRPHRRPTRLVVFANQIEDRIPGRAALVLHRSRSIGRSRSIDGMRLLEQWARRRAERLSTDGRQTRPSHGEGETGPASADDHLTDVATPDETWTKGRIYEVAQTLELEGRSKLNKADLLEAVLAALDDRAVLDGPDEPVYAEPRTPIESSA